MIKNLSQLGLQLGEIWKQLGINQRLSVILAAAVVLLGLGSLVFWSTRVDYALLYGRLEESEAAKIVAVLDEMKVPKKLGHGGNSIMVPGDKVYALRMQLASRGLPRGEGVGFEIFDKPNFGLSDFIQRANYLRAVQGELARSISQLDEVEGARVFIVMPENRLLADSQKRPTASVIVRVKGQAQLTTSAINSIRFLVANAVEGLQANHVAVIDNHGTVLSENSENDSLQGLTSSQLQVRRNLEQYLSKKAEDMLQKVLGPGQAVVRVAADINFDTKNLTEEKYDPEGQVARSDTITDEKTDTTASSQGGIPGVSANSNTESNAVAAMPANNTKVAKKVSNKEYEIGKTTSTLLQSPGGIKRLSAAVFVAAKLEGTGAARKVVPRTEDELAKLKRIVQSALGIQMGSDPSRSDEIVLEEMAFNDQFNLDFTDKVEKQEKRDFWLNLAQGLIYPALALAVLVVFWRTFKRTPAESIPIGIPLGPLTIHGNGHGNGNGKHGNGHTQPSWASRMESGVITVEVLNQLVRENPANMTQAIRSWMGRSKPE
jgi:flagellar M-ring protein FliF